MSSYAPFDLTVPVTVTTGDPIDVNPRSPVGFSLGGTFVATVKFQYSPVAVDPDETPSSVWFDVGTALTAAGYQELAAGKAKRVRANTTAWTSGTPVAVVFADRGLVAQNLERTFKVEDIAVAEEVAAGAANDLEDGEQATIHIGGTFTGTVQAQISLSADGSVWHDWGRPLTAAGFIRIQKGKARRVRLNTTAWTSGAPVASLLRGFCHEEGDDITVESLVAPGALSVYARTSLLSIDGTDAFTLADGFYEGQRKTVAVIAAVTTPRGTLTMATTADSIAPVLTSVGQRLELEWHDSGGWRIVGFNNRDGFAADAIAAPGALSVNTLLSTLAVDGTDAFTLAAGLYAGQQKFVRCISVANTPHGTLTPAAVSGYSTIEFNAAEQFALLMWTGAAWIIVATGGTPTIA